MRPRGNTFIQQIQLYDKYARWRADEQRRETWPEVVDRVLTFFQSQPKAVGLTPDVWAQLRTAFLAQDILPSMRVVQMAGPALDRCHVGAYNCAYTTLTGPQDVAEVLYILMQGTGVGYSVERRYVEQWPEVSVAPEEPIGTYRVPDTTEGWCEAFRRAIEGALAHQVWTFDLSQIRPEGAWLHTKGGRASGPAPLRHLLDQTWAIIRARAGQRLRPLDVHRLATLCGSIVQVGGVRRAAEIALFDADDAEMRTCKAGPFWDTMPELAMANNSMVIPPGAPDLHLLSAMAEASTSGTGEPGLFRRDGRIPDRRTPADFGTNPCGEIILRPHQFCNLSVAVARATDTPETLAYKVQLATVLGTLQADLTTFQYLRPTWAANCNEERLLGVDITGACDCPLLTDPDTTPALLQRLQQVAVTTNAALAAQMGIPASVAVTCNKPSGNSSQLLDAASGIHPRYAPYYLRRLRLGARSPLAEHLRQLGLPMFPEVGQGSTLDEARVWVTELPVAAPEGAVTRHDLSGLDQLAYWLMWKTCWTEHNPSCTIYLKPHEWVAATAFVASVWDAIGGLSFLPHSDHVYALAPYEEIDRATYEARVAALPESLGLDLLRERVDTTTLNQDYACIGGRCEI
jgi:ribonucleoside-triphosphate reductase